MNRAADQMRVLECIKAAPKTPGQIAVSCGMARVKVRRIIADLSEAQPPRVAVAESICIGLTYVDLWQAVDAA